MKAIIGATVVAEAPESDTVDIEGNAYFPPSAVKQGALSDSDTQYTCPWKGDAQYYNVTTKSGVTPDGAWSYPSIKDSAVDRVGLDFAGFVAFAPGVELRK
jgi:uncharacterized protein (DUF427 family)